MHDLTCTYQAIHAESCPNDLLASTVYKTSAHEPLIQGSILSYSTRDRHSTCSGSLGPDAAAVGRPRLWGSHQGTTLL